MNHIYKVVWSKVKNAYVVGSEFISASQGRGSYKAKASCTGKTLERLVMAALVAGTVGSAAGVAQAADDPIYVNKGDVYVQVATEAGKPDVKIYNDGGVAVGKIHFGQDGVMWIGSDQGNTFSVNGNTTPVKKLAGETATIGTVTISEAPENGKSTVSGLADGKIEKGSTDAVTGGQLKTTNEAVKTNADDITALNTYTGIGTTLDNKAANLAAGINTNYDLIQKAQTEAEKHTTVTGKSDNVIINPTKNADGSTNYDVSLNPALTLDAISNDNGNTLDLQKGTMTLGDTTIQNGDITTSGAITAANGNFRVKDDGSLLAQTGNAQLSLGGNGVLLHKGSSAVTMTDDVLRLGSNNTKVEIGAAGTAFSDAAGKTTTIAGNTITTNKVTGLANGVNASDAVNMSQLSAVQTEAGKHTTLTEQDGNLVITETETNGQLNYDVSLSPKLTLDSISNQNGNTLDLANGKLSLGKVTVDQDMAMANYGETQLLLADGAASLSVGNSAFGVTANQIQATAGGNSLTLGGGGAIFKDSNNKTTAVKGDTISTGTITANKVTGLTDGTALTDAVNVSQLNAVQAEAKKHTTVTGKNSNIIIHPSTNADGSENYDVSLNPHLTLTSIANENGNGINLADATMTLGSVSIQDGDVKTAYYSLNDIGSNTALIKRVDDHQTIIGGIVDIVGEGNRTPGLYVLTEDGTDMVHRFSTDGSADIGEVTISKDGAITAAGGTMIGNVLFNQTKDESTGKTLTTLSGVAAGVEGNDAVNVNQLNAVQTEAEKHSTVTGKSDNVIINPTKNEDGSTNYDVSLNPALTLDAISNDNGNSLDLQKGTMTLGDTTIQNGDITTSGAITAANGNFRVKDDGSLLAQTGNAQLSLNGNGVLLHKGSSAVTMTDDVLRLSSNGTKVELGATGTVFSDAAGATTTIAGNTLTTGTITANKVTGLAAGVDASDAVNVSQLEAVQAEADKHTTITTSDSNVVLTKTDTDGQLNYDVAINPDLTVDSVSNGSNVINLKNGTMTLDGTTIKDGNITTTGALSAANGNFKVNTDGSLTATAGDTAFMLDKRNGAVLYSGNSSLILNDAAVQLVSNGSTLALGSSGTVFTNAAGTQTTIDGSTITANKVTGLAAGTAGSDAVNVDQLNNTIAEANKDSVQWDNADHNTINGVGLEDGKVTADNGISAGSGNFTVDKDGNLNIGNGNFTVDAATGDTQIGGALNVGDSLTVNGESVATSGQIDKINDKLGTGEFTTGKDQTYTEAINQNAANIGTIQGQIGANADGTLDLKNEGSTLVEGINTNTASINTLNTMVGTGKLDNGAADLTAGINANTAAISQNSQNIAALGTSVSKLDTRLDRVGAGAAALAALHPLDFDPDAKWDFAAGYGNYRGANAAAVGAYYRPNEDLMFSVGGSMGGGENMVNAGVSIKLGAGSSHVTTSRTAMAKEIVALRDQVQQLTAVVNKLIGGQQAAQSELSAAFPDVPENHWAYEAVQNLAAKGIIEGYPDGTFGGNRSMTRYEFASLVNRALQKGFAVTGDLEKLATEFAPELDQLHVDTIAKDKNGNPTIERVRVTKREAAAEAPKADAPAAEAPADAQ